MHCAMNNSYIWQTYTIPMSKKIISGKTLKITIHLLIWLLILSIPSFFLSNTIDDKGHFLGRFYFRVLMNGLFFYISYLVFVPQLYLQNKKLIYLLVSILSVVFIFIIDAFLVERIFPDDEFRRIMGHVNEVLAQQNIDIRPPFPEMKFIGSIVLNLLLAGSALGIRLAEALSQKEDTQKELEKQRLATELTMLKNQVSPHFFFNTLNNIYSLTESNPDKSRQAILKLSRMMRYLLYETNNELTPLSREIDFMNDYIELMKLRLTNKVVVNSSLPFKEDCDTISIPPLLLIPFIENAFKHGVSNREASFIEINMTIGIKKIEFICHNSKFENVSEIIEPGGIGLENVQKRLELIYPGNFSLHIQSNQNDYLVRLSLNLI